MPLLSSQLARRGILEAVSGHVAPFFASYKPFSHSQSTSNYYIYRFSSDAAPSPSPPLLACTERCIYRQGLVVRFPIPRVGDKTLSEIKEGS